MKNRNLLMFIFWCFILSSVICFLSSVAEANIVVRAVLVNPSTQKRTIPFKSVLPKEVKPENIVDSGELEVAYDPSAGAYYVYHDYTLGPKESMTIEIEMEDVWKIPQDELNGLREEAARLTKILSNTDYYERASYLKNSIESKLNQIETSQQKMSASPGGYISDYRENLDRIESIKADLAAAKTLVAEAKNIAPALTWKLIIAVVIFLGVLGLIFFIIWQRQIKSLVDFVPDAESDAKLKGKERPLEPEEGERREAVEDKKSDINDIEKRLKKEQ
ncbi:MAG: hypothetical protein ABIC68_05785 [Candidatus Omnitrophota bacterium]